ncbi:hypothetical protein STCU_10021 [Strigomonas culicis]|uniref:Proteophosphoglycan ppg4 n=1 Tax=Strigomonas culicis TaxID=28005 RepID=S9TNR5_9TRYP|nr:hypothetical protein STCU_10021 [Strigomonas culicis]|eukprot:EPY18354.1 hypothetical protein STCU_10021 [Strigomonas culicis]
MSFFCMDGFVNGSKLASEYNLTGNSQGNIYTESGFSFYTNSHAVAVEPAEENKAPYSPRSEGLNCMLAETREAIPLPVGTLTPTKAAALRQERVAPAITGGAVPTPPCSPKENVPTARSGDFPLSMRRTRDRSGTYSYASQKSVCRESVENTWSYSFYSPTNRATLPFVSDSVEESADNRSDATPRGYKVIKSDGRKRCVPTASDSITGTTEISDRDTLEGQWSATKGARRSSVRPQGEPVATAEMCAPNVPVYGGFTNHSRLFPHKSERGAMDHLQSFSNKLEQQPSSPCVSTSFKYGGPTSLMYSSLRRQSSAAGSLMYDIQPAISWNAFPSMLVSETTAVPAPGEDDDVGEHMGRFLDYCAGDTKGDGCEDDRMADHTPMERLSSDYSDASAGPGLQRTDTLFPDIFTTLTRSANNRKRADAAEPLPSLAAPDTSDVTTRAPSTFSLNAVMQRRTSFYWGDRSADGMDGDGEEPREAVCEKGKALSTSEGLSSADSLLQDLSTLPACTPRPPPDRLRAPSYHRPVMSLVEESAPPLSAVASPRCDATGTPRRAPTPDAHLRADPQAEPQTVDAGNAPLKVAKTLAMRYLSPQPAMTGPPVPEVPKLDPRRLFGGDCLAEAQWVSSPRDVDLDAEDPAPTAPTAPKAPDVCVTPEVPVLHSTITVLGSKGETRTADKKEDDKVCQNHSENSHSKKKEKKRGDIITFFMRRR